MLLPTVKGTNTDRPNGLPNLLQLHQCYLKFKKWHFIVV